MARKAVTTGRSAWTDKELHSDVRPHMRNLAEAMQSLCRYLLPDKSAIQAGKRLTQAMAAARIHCCESSLSRYLSGQSMPDLAIVRTLHREACRDAGGERAVSLTLEALTMLHKHAEAERSRRGGGELAAEVDTLNERLREADSERLALRQEIAELRALRDEATALRATVAELRSARAGLQARVVEQLSSGPLPVPRRKRDRQRMRRDAAAVRNLAAQAGDLDAAGQAGAALRLLRRSSEVFNPLETAGLLLLLRQRQHDELADNLIHVYGRDQGDQDVLRVVLALHQQGAFDDAGAILHAALE